MTGVAVVVGAAGLLNDSEIVESGVSGASTSLLPWQVGGCCGGRGGLLLLLLLLLLPPRFSYLRT